MTTTNSNLSFKFDSFTHCDSLYSCLAFTLISVFIVSLVVFLLFYLLRPVDQLFSSCECILQCNPFGLLLFIQVMYIVICSSMMK